MKGERYGDALALTDKMLLKNPSNKNVQQLATKALIKEILSDLDTYLNEAAFIDASAFLSTLAEKSQNNPEGLRVIDLFNWIVLLEAYSHQRDLEALVLYQDEKEIENLLQKWNEKEEDYRVIFYQILGIDSSFEILHQRVFSHLNIIQSQKKSYFKIIQEFKDSINRALEGGQPENLKEVIRNFEQKYTNIKGMQKLSQDLVKYLKLWELINNKQIMKIAGLTNQLQFQTEPFLEKYLDICSNILPSSDIIQQYQEALTAWVSGDSQKAIKFLKRLTSEKWGEVASAKLSRYQKVLMGYKNLRSTKSRPTYSKTLISFHNFLNREEDIFFMDLIQSDFIKVQKKEAVRAKEFVIESKNQWEQYQETGPISGLLRLEATVSTKFKKSAAHLRSAFENALTGTQLYRQIHYNVPEEYKLLFETIQGEVQKQHSSMIDLKNVLNPKIWSTKIKLLPETPGMNQ